MSNRAFFRDRFLLTLRIESLHSLAPSRGITADFVMQRDSEGHHTTG